MEVAHGINLFDSVPAARNVTADQVRELKRFVHRRSMTDKMLRLRVSLGHLVGTAPALLSLADLEPDPEAARLRAEAARLYELLGAIPTWLAPSFAP